MKTLKTKNLVIAGLALMVSTSAWAEFGSRKGDASGNDVNAPKREGKGPKDQRPHRPPPIPFKVLDADSNGGVTFDEWTTAHQERREKMKQRIKAEGKKPRADRPKGNQEDRDFDPEKRAETIFSKIDADGSKEISQDEYKTALKRMFQHHQATCNDHTGGPKGPRRGGAEDGGEEVID